MGLCLSGRMMDEVDAERCRLVSRVVPAAKLMDAVMNSAQKIAQQSRSAAMLTKESINKAKETMLAEGIPLRATVVRAAFATVAQKDGVAA